MRDVDAYPRVLQGRLGLHGRAAVAAGRNVTEGGADGYTSSDVRPKREADQAKAEGRRPPRAPHAECRCRRMRLAIGWGRPHGCHSYGSLLTQRGVQQVRQPDAGPLQSIPHKGHV